MGLFCYDESMSSRRLYSIDYFEGQDSIERYAPFSLLAPLTKRNKWVQRQVLQAIKAKERRFAHKRALAILNNFRPKKTLDVGTATGELIEELLKEKVDAWGVEASDYMISAQKNPQLSKRILRAYADKLPFENESFDVVTGYHLLEHIQEQELEKNLGEMARVSKKIIFFEFPTTKNPWGKVDNTHVSLFNDGWWLKKFQKSLPEWEVDYYRSSNTLRAMQVTIKKKGPTPFKPRNYS